MTLKNKSRIISCVICFLFIISLIFSLSFIVSESHHECTGENCPVCAQIKICFAVIHTLASVSTVTVLSFMHLPVLKLTNEIISQNYSFQTPISLKDELLD